MEPAPVATQDRLRWSDLFFSSPDEPRFLSFLGIRAEIADVCWLGGADDPLLLDERNSLFLLGQADGVVVLYDSSADQVLRVPSSLVALIVSDVLAPGAFLFDEPSRPRSDC